MGTVGARVGQRPDNQVSSKRFGNMLTPPRAPMGKRNTLTPPCATMGKNVQHGTSQEVLALRARVAESESQRTLAEEEATTLRRQLRSIQLVNDANISLANTPSEHYGQLEEYEALCVELREQLAEGLNDAACG